MSIIPEYIIQQVLVQGITQFRENEKLLDVLFHNMLQSEISGLKDFFRESSIDISLNYPHQDLKLPAIVILLKGESQDQEFLGELLQDHFSVAEIEPTPFKRDIPEGDATVEGGGSVGPVWGKGDTVLEPVTAVAGGSNYVDVPEGTFDHIDPYEFQVSLEIVEGTGAGQKKVIAGIDPRRPGLPARITISGSFFPEPDDTSIVRIVNPDDEEGITGEPSKIFGDFNDPEEHQYERIGSVYRASYQLLILGANPETTIYMYVVVKTILFLLRHFLLKQGFHDLQISGSDFLPRSEYLPGLAYQRALNMDFLYTFSVYREIEDQAISRIVFALTGNHPDDTVPGIEKDLIETELDLT